MLTPPDASKINSGKGLSGTPSSNRPPEPRAEKRRDGAQARQASSDLRKRVAKLERDLEEAEALASSLHDKLADPDIYDQPEEVHRLANEHDAAKARAAALMDKWTEAAAELEA